MPRLSVVACAGRLIRVVLRASLLVGAAACTDQNSLQPLAKQPVFVTPASYDAMPGSFAWLAPLGSATGDPLSFDANPATVVEICRWSGTACAAPPIARFTVAPIAPVLPLTINSVAGRYEAAWSLNDATFTTRRTYRIRVLQSAAELGAISVDVVRGRWALTRTDGTLAPLIAATELPIKFRALPAIRPKSLGANAWNTCALTTDGSPWCWGFNAYGLMGNGFAHFATPTTGAMLYPTPQAVQNSPQFVAVETGDFAACGLTASGVASCWGNNAGNLGTGMQSPREYFPTRVVGGHTFRALATGAYTTCGLDLMGIAWCWGTNSYGELGAGLAQGTAVYTPTRVSGDDRYSVIAAGAGSGHVCGIVIDGHTNCWGDNREAELGNGDVNYATNYINPSPAPVVGAPRSFTALALGAASSCALDSEGATYCWGRNVEGQLGSDRRARALR